MKTADSYLDETSTPFEQIIGTSAAPDEELASGENQGESDKWNSLIDNYLIEWGRHPEKIAIDNDTPPDQKVISTAIEIAIALRDQDLEAADRITPNGDGGLTFEWFKDDGNFFLIGIRKSKRVMFESYHNGNLVDEKTLVNT